MTFLSRLAISAAIAGATLHSPASAQSPIKIGQYGSLTGKEAAWGQSSIRGTVTAVEEINAAGGVLGRKLELITEDNQSKAGESATIARKLISRDKVVALLGEVASMRSLEAAPIAQQAKVPMITPSSTNPKVTEIGPYVFRVCFIDPFQGLVMAKFAAKTLQLRKVAVLTSVSSAYSVGLAKYFKEQFARDGGKIALEQKYSEGDKDFKAQLTAIKAAGVDGLFVPGYYTEAALICKQAKDLGLKVPILGGDGWEAPQLMEIGGTAVEGTYYSTHYSAEVKSPIVTAFIEKYKQRWNGQVPDALAALAYDSVFILADAIKRAGSTEGPKLRDALAATKNFPGVTGTTTLDAQRNAAKEAVVLTVKNGKFKFVESIAP
jgi:branched-chain amino acid transport system substrate-binding protein